VGVGRGCYYLVGEPLDPDLVKGGQRRRAQRPKPIGTQR
jgi:hypothetical protein